MSKQFYEVQYMKKDELWDRLMQYLKYCNVHEYELKNLEFWEKFRHKNEKLFQEGHIFSLTKWAYSTY
jgi:NTP pyrophosphatase (non-canonical NTP hydrolase)